VLNQPGILVECEHEVDAVDPSTDLLRVRHKRRLKPRDSRLSERQDTLVVVKE
jgi:hypothetical protein